MQWARAVAATVIFPACSLAISLDGFSAGATGDKDSGGSEDGGTTDDGAPLDADVEPDPAALSCDAIHQSMPSAPDGFQRIDPDGPSGPLEPFRAWCDMTTDGGGWMLVSASLVGDEDNLFGTAVRSEDAHGGLVLRVFVNSNGCGDPPTRHRFFILDRPTWSRVRFKQTFAGQAACWHIWGGDTDNAPLPSNLVPFNLAVDVIRDAVRMGGTGGDAFDGDPDRCDEQSTNHWWHSTGELRSASVVIRRMDAARPSGLSTGADCAGAFGEGTTSPLWWEYSDIYVK